MKDVDEIPARQLSGACKLPARLTLALVVFLRRKDCWPASATQVCLQMQFFANCKILLSVLFIKRQACQTQTTYWLCLYWLRWNSRHCNL